MTFSVHEDKTVIVEFSNTVPNFRYSEYSVSYDAWILVDENRLMLFGFADAELPDIGTDTEDILWDEYKNSVKYQIAIFDNIPSAIDELLKAFEYPDTLYAYDQINLTNCSLKKDV